MHALFLFLYVVILKIDRYNLYEVKLFSLPVGKKNIWSLSLSCFFNCWFDK